MHIQIPRKAYLVRFVLSTPGKILLGLFTFCFVATLTVFLYFWFHFSHLIDEKLSEGPFANTAQLFAAPEPISVGDILTREELVQLLRRRGYSDTQKSRMGWYKVRADGVEIFPGADSYFDQEPGVIFIDGARVVRIVSNRDNTERPQYSLEPELITNLFDRKRQKRRMVKFDDIPPVVRNAILAAEDHRFFQHAGFDPIRIVGAALGDLRGGNRKQGASTLTMQVARTFFLNRDRTFSRKAAELLITLELEHRLTKEQIFEHYVNYIDLGWRRSFAVQGFGEAAQVHYGKDLRELNLDEAALLAGMVQGPNLYNPFRSPDKALARRNTILGMMRENGYVTDKQYDEAVKAPIKLREGGIETSDAPYFVDYVNEDLQEQFQDHDFQARSYRIYTSLDMKLQRDAVDAVRIGMKEVDDQLARRRKKYPEAQVAMVVLDPHTGEVKALVGGRNYGQSQLNRVFARRQPGSAFKPFVYAAALSTALNGGGEVLTPLSTVVDEPTVFSYDGMTYEPGNFGQKFYGTVNMRYALSKSMNIATIKFGEKAGFENVVKLVRDAGMNRDIKPTPAIALGSYVVTPYEIAGAYTVFSNGGTYVKPAWMKEIRSETGSLIFATNPLRRDALDPRISYMTVNLMEEVLRSGTGAGARSRGFGLPAAGKTGTSHDAWFAGFTSKLLCVVWVGFDDNQEMPLEGAQAALPVWTEFMKRAHQHREYRGVQEFQAPDGIVTAEVDPLTDQLATSNCPNPRSEVFIAGTQPVDLCKLHGGSGRTTIISGWETPEAGKGDAPADARPRAPRRSVAARATTAAPAKDDGKPKEEKKGFWGRIRDIFK